MHFYHSHKLPILFILVAVFAAGYFAYSRIEIALFPNVDFPKVKVIAEAGEQPVQQMLTSVTIPLENAIKQVPGEQIIRSNTSRGSCDIEVTFAWNSNIDLEMSLLQARIGEVQSELPPGINFIVQKMSPAVLPVMGYALEEKDSSKQETDESQIELKKIATYTIRPYLAGIGGVSNIQILGGKNKEYWVQLHPDAMVQLGISPVQITNAINNSNFLLSNGLINDYDRLYLTITDATFKNLDDIKNLVVRNDGKRIIYLKDLADVIVHAQDEYTRVNANGRSAVLVNVIRQPDANLVKVTDEVQQKVKALQNILPAGMEMKPYYVQADFVNTSIQSVSDAILIGLLLAILVTILFLNSFRASATLLICIPITLSLTILTLFILGFTINIMTLGAIAASIGLIIDDSIVVVEQIHKMEEESSGASVMDNTKRAVHFLLPALLSSSLSTIIIFAPFALLTGLAGAFFKQLAATMVITLISSFLVSWLGLPVVYNLFRKKTNQKKNIFKTKSKKLPWLEIFIHRPWIAIVVVIILIGSSYYFINHLETGFLPDMDEGAIVLDYKTPPGTSLDETDKILRNVEKIILANHEVESYSRRTGTEMGFFITEPNSGDYLIELKKDRKESTDDVISDLRQEISSTEPALTIDFGQVLGDILGDLSGAAQPIEIKIFGNDPQKINFLAKQVAGITDSVKGTADVFNGIIVAGPSITIHPKIENLALHNLTAADLQQQVELQLRGLEVSHIFDNQQYLTLRVRFPSSEQNDLFRIQHMMIFTPEGMEKTLSYFADISIDEGVTEVDRENLQSFLSVTARLDNRDLGSVMHDIRQKINHDVILSKGYYIEYGGSYLEQQQSFRELLIILVTSVILVFSILLFMFRDWKISTLVLFLSVLGISGCVTALYITNTPLNVGSYTGIIMIVGIIAENCIFTMQQFQMKRQTESVRAAAHYAIVERIRPKLMTAFGAIIALMPLALGIGTGAQLHQPLAIAVIGGFCAAIPILLIILPAMLVLIIKEKKEIEI
jgi:heavy metal efflux system protein